MQVVVSVCVKEREGALTVEITPSNGKATIGINDVTAGGTTSVIQ